MAPIGMVDMLGGFATPEVGIISLVVFLILSITLVALCAPCKRNTGNAYDVNNSKTDGGAVPDQTSWRDHKNMPASTLTHNSSLSAQ